MLIRNIFIFVLMLLPGIILAQQQERRLPPNINHMAINLYAPYVSGDGNTLIYLSDHTDDNHHVMYWTKRVDREWADGTEINSLINRPTHNMRGAYALNHEGDKLYFTSRKSGLGGYDIWVSERAGNDWRAPKNLGAPLNTPANEGAPSFTPDGKTMYYMECETMFEYKPASGCKIMVSKFVRGRWQKGTELPANINTGNSQIPRILGDHETLLFASDQQGGKGGMDIFMTRKEGESWTDPVPVSSLNGPNDDMFVSATAKGRYVFRSVKGRRNRELVETLLPEDVRSRRVMRVTGVFEGPGMGKLLVYNTEKRNRLENQELQAGDEFSLILREGSSYDISISDPSGKYMYYSEIKDLEKIGRIDKESLNVSLRSLESGDTLSNSISFTQHTNEWEKKYDFEFRRIADFTKQPGESKVEILIVNPQYIEDSIRHPWATQMRLDTLYAPVNDSLRLWPDPIAQEGRRIVEYGSDSLYVITDSDSIKIARADLKIDTVYHNDYSDCQLMAVKEFMHERSVDTSRYRVKSVLVPAQSPLEEESDQEEIPKQPERIIAILKD